MNPNPSGKVLEKSTNTLLWCSNISRIPRKRRIPIKTNLVLVLLFFQTFLINSCVILKLGLRIIHNSFIIFYEKLIDYISDSVIVVKM